MKKFKAFLIITIILIVLYFLSGKYFGGLIYGYKDGHFVIYKYTCTDFCPRYGSWSIQFAGNISEDDCLKIGGQPNYVTFIDQGKVYNGCSPK